MTLQWLGNNNNNVKHDFLTRMEGYEEEQAVQDSNQCDVLMHGFELTKNSRLPAPLLRASQDTHTCGGTPHVQLQLPSTSKNSTIIMR
jgi:hypothetical protein